MFNPSSNTNSLFNPSISDCVAEVVTAFATVRLLGIGGAHQTRKDVLATRLEMRTETVKMFHFRVYDVDQEAVDAATPDVVRTVLTEAVLAVMRDPKTYARFGRLSFATKSGVSQVRARLFKMVVPEVEESLLG